MTNIYVTILTIEIRINNVQRCKFYFILRNQRWNSYFVRNTFNTSLWNAKWTKIQLALQLRANFIHPFPFLSPVDRDENIRIRHFVKQDS